MIQILLSGCGGAMGRTIIGAVNQRDDVSIVAGIDPHANPADFSFPVFSSPDEAVVDGVDVIIDFSHPSGVAALVALAVEKKLPLVEAITGLEEAQLQLLQEASEEIPLFFSANMSLGVNLLLHLAKKATQVLGTSFDIEIIEKHHNQKVDAPSGTALMLADAIREELTSPTEYVYDRHSKRQKRSKQEIGIHAIRGGTIVGEHEILFAGQDETLSLSHSASSKTVFATGALNAACFLAQKKPEKPGLYDMGDLIG